MGQDAYSERSHVGRNHHGEDSANSRPIRPDVVYRRRSIQAGVGVGPVAGGYPPSFNENEPIVCEPAEAIDCYQRTKMDVLAIGPFVCKKTDS